MVSESRHPVIDVAGFVADPDGFIGAVEIEPADIPQFRIDRNVGRIAGKT